MSEYILKMWCDGGGEDTDTVEADLLSDAIDQAEEMVRDWVRNGDWGDEGALVGVRYTLTDEDGDALYWDSITVEIEPDHEAMIHKACGRDCGCGLSPDDHDWTREGEGGCDENPGVWSHGGTAMSFASHCRDCGLRRREYHCGSQRNPGECDTVKYEMPECDDEE